MKKHKLAPSKLGAPQLSGGTGMRELRKWKRYMRQLCRYVIRCAHDRPELRANAANNLRLLNRIKSSSCLHQVTKYSEEDSYHVHQRG